MSVASPTRGPTNPGLIEKVSPFRWFPLWSVNAADPWLAIYLNKSRELARTTTLPPAAAAAAVEAEAKRQWDVAVKSLFLQTLSTAKTMRPRASWGWYDYPACS